jgi:hypothetical protein
MSESALTPGPSPSSPLPFPGRGGKSKDRSPVFFCFFLSPLSRRGSGWEMGEGPGVRASAPTSLEARR